jgi:nucleoside-diphosphate-sugar epimerase
MARAAVLGHLIKLFAPDAYRPFLHIRDAAAAIAHCLHVDTAQSSFKVFNIVGENYQKRQLADLVTKHYISGGQPDLRDYKVSSQRAASELQFVPAHTVEIALLETANAVRMHVFRDPMWNGYSAIPDSAEAIRRRPEASAK